MIYDVTGEHLHGPKNVGTSQRYKCQEILLKKLQLSESDKPPSTHILFISDFHFGHLGSGESHDVPIISQSGNNASAVFAMKIIQSDLR